MLKGIYLTLMVGPVVPVPVPKAGARRADRASRSRRSRHAEWVSVELHAQQPVAAAHAVSHRRRPDATAARHHHRDNQRHAQRADGRRNDQSAGESRQQTWRVDAHDHRRRFDQGDVACMDFSGIPYPAMPPEARVALIIAKYAMFGMIPLVIPVSLHRCADSG